MVAEFCCRDTFLTTAWLLSFAVTWTVAVQARDLHAHFDTTQAESAGGPPSATPYPCTGAPLAPDWEGILCSLPNLHANAPEARWRHASEADGLDTNRTGTNLVAATVAPAELPAANPCLTGLATHEVANERAQKIIQRGYALAQHGATFAARNSFCDALYVIASSMDESTGTSRATEALERGLSAIEEAGDFTVNASPRGGRAALELIVRSHLTPVAKDQTGLTRQQLAEKYYLYAQTQLGEAMAGEVMGSLALHALGKVYSQMAMTDAKRKPEADRCAVVLQQAALAARSDNDLAAHELAVLLAELGRYAESEFLLQQVAARQPHPMVFSNLAEVQRKLGWESMAQASDFMRRELEKKNQYPDSPVNWVPPSALEGPAGASGIRSAAR